MTQPLLGRELVKLAMCGVRVVSCPPCLGVGHLGPSTLLVVCPTCGGRGLTTINEQEAPMSAEEKGVAEDQRLMAAAAADQVEPLERGSFRITKFSEHSDGYLHARLTTNGATYYVHDRFGSWMAPGSENGKTVLKEVLSPYRGALAEKARAFRKAKRLRQAAIEGEARAALGMDYAPESVAAALIERYKLTDSQAASIVAEVQAAVVPSNTIITDQRTDGG